MTMATDVVIGTAAHVKLINPFTPRLYPVDRSRVNEFGESFDNREKQD